MFRPESKSPHEAIEEIARQVVKDQQLQVTRLDTQALSNKLDTALSRFWWTWAMLTLILTVLIASYGATAFFTWRLIGALLDAES